jgi:hypothetical protein
MAKKKKKKVPPGKKLIKKRVKVIKRGKERFYEKL